MVHGWLAGWILVLLVQTPLDLLLLELETGCCGMTWTAWMLKENGEDGMSVVKSAERKERERRKGK